jgi:histidinol phosphatase-like PHP family hydrolase
MKHRKKFHVDRRQFIKTATMTTSTIIAAPLFSCEEKRDKIDYQYMDLHIHEARQFGIDEIMKISEEKKVKFGIVQHPGSNYGIKTDKDLEEHIKRLRKYPVFIGLQPVFRDWSKDFSKELLDQLDYILMDPQTIPDENNTYMHIWQFDTRVDDTTIFMKKYMDHCIGILENEPINIFGWPLFLPVCIARDYYAIWSEEKLQTIIQLAKARNIAIEINEMAHVPHEAFIKDAKSQGLKFTYGSDARDNRAGDIVYGKRIAETCGLSNEDFYVPGKKS